MGSFKRALFAFLLLAPLTAAAEPMHGVEGVPPPLPSLGPIPREAEDIARWLAQWPRWQEERRHLQHALGEMRERLRDQGEAEARRGQRLPWWNLPLRQRQTARLRYLQRLRADLERAQARYFQIRAVETQWLIDLEGRKQRRRLAPPLRPVLEDLQAEAEKDLFDREESV